MKRKILSVVLTLAMALSLLPTAVFAVEYSDTTGHWAASAIDRWSGYGVVQGTDDGFQPDASMTRAQAATVFSNLLGLKASTGTQTWADADPNAWYMGALRSANDAGIMNGVGDGRMNPNGEVTREQFFTMFARAIGLKPQETTSGVAADGADWSKGYINALTDKGFVKGDGTSVNALADINRASVMTLLDQTITTYANEPGATVEGTGEGVVLVAADGVTVTGNVDTLVVAEAASGETGVKVENATVGQLSVTGATEVALAGETKVDTVVVAEAAEGASLAVAAGAQVTSVEVAAPKASIENSGVIASVQVTETATAAEVKAEAGSYTGVIATEAKTTSVSGAGAVASVVASGEAAATGNNGVQVTTSGTNTYTVEASGETKSDKTSGALPAASGSNAAAATAATQHNNTDTNQAVIDAGGTLNRPTQPSSSSSDYDGPTETDVTERYGVRTANLDDRAVDGDEPEANLAGNYAATATRWSNRDYVDVKVTADQLKAHMNGDTTSTFGYWIGVAFAAPEHYTAHKVGISLNRDTAASRFEDAAVTANEGIGGDTAGFAQYVDASVESQRDFWVKLQWFFNTESTSSEQSATLFHVVIEPTLKTVIKEDETLVVPHDKKLVGEVIVNNGGKLLFADDEAAQKTLCGNSIAGTVNAGAIVGIGAEDNYVALIGPMEGETYSDHNLKLDTDAVLQFGDGWIQVRKGIVFADNWTNGWDFEAGNANNLYQIVVSGVDGPNDTRTPDVATLAVIGDLTIKQLSGANPPSGLIVDKGGMLRIGEDATLTIDSGAKAEIIDGTVSVNGGMLIKSGAEVNVYGSVDVTEGMLNVRGTLNVMDDGTVNNNGYVGLGNVDALDEGVPAQPQTEPAKVIMGSGSTWNGESAEFLNEIVKGKSNQWVFQSGSRWIMDDDLTNPVIIGSADDNAEYQLGTNSVMMLTKNGATVAQGTVTLNNDLPDGTDLVKIDQGATLTIAEGTTLTIENDGKLVINGVLNIEDGATVHASENTVKAVLTAANSYNYDPAYTRTGTIDVNELTVSYSAPQSAFTAQDSKAVDDLARFLGAMHRNTAANAATIKYSNKTYTWNNSGTLLGSNWENNSTTLVSAIAAALGTGLQGGNNTNFTISVDGVSVTINVTISGIEDEHLVIEEG